MTEPKGEILLADQMPEPRSELARRGLGLLRFGGAESGNIEWLAARPQLLPYMVGSLRGAALPSDPMDEVVWHDPAFGSEPNAVLALKPEGPEEAPELVSYGDLSLWGVSSEEAWTSALANLDAHLVDLLFEEPQSGNILVRGWDNPPDGPPETRFAGTLLMSRAFRTWLCARLASTRCVVCAIDRLLWAMLPGHADIDTVTEWSWQPHSRYLISRSGDRDEVTYLNRDGLRAVLLSAK